MANTHEDPVDTSAVVIDTPNLNRSRDETLAMLVRRIERAEKSIKPFNIANIMQLIGIAVAIVVAIFTAFGLNNRIDDLRGAQAQTDNHLTASETRLDGRISKVDDSVGKLDERLSRIEGQLSNHR